MAVNVGPAGASVYRRSSLAGAARRLPARSASVGGMATVYSTPSLAPETDRRAVPGEPGLRSAEETTRSGAGDILDVTSQPSDGTTTASPNSTITYAAPSKDAEAALGRVRSMTAVVPEVTDACVTDAELGSAALSLAVIVNCSSPSVSGESTLNECAHVLPVGSAAERDMGVACGTPSSAALASAGTVIMGAPPPSGATPSSNVAVIVMVAPRVA